MRKMLLLSLVAIAVGVSACNHDSFPTGSEQDLLQNPANAPALDGSKFGQGIAVDGSGAIVDAIPALPASSDSTAGSVHITSGPNQTRFHPENYVHISTGGANNTKYKPVNWYHYNGYITSDRTKYIPINSYHLKSGPNESRYQIK